MKIGGSTALVTGGAVRVGRAISLSLSRAGARVIVHYNRSGGPANALADEISRGGGEAAVVQADLREASGVDRLVTDAERAFGGVDILVNNASVFPADGFEEVDAAIWEEAIAVNLRAPFFLTQKLGRSMKARGAGVIVNVADLAGIQSWNGYAAHAISKAGLIHLTRLAARALAPEVRVVAIAPGTVLPPDDLGEDEIERLARRSPLRRNGSPEDVTEAVKYLIGADFVTGEVLVVDGGRLLT